MKTISIVTDDYVKDNSSFTFPLIIGKKGDNHVPVDRIINENLQGLFFHDNHVGDNAPFNVKVPWSDTGKQLLAQLVASIADQPARREYTALSAGNGKYTGRWSFNGNWTACHEHVPCCEQCFHDLLHNHIFFHILNGQHIFVQIVLNG